MRLIFLFVLFFNICKGQFLINPYINTVYDADAQAYFTAADITDFSEKTAYNNFVVSLKADNIYSKMYCLYPFLGGSSTTTKYNAINTSNYQINWSGGVTFTNGITGNGSNGFGDSNFNPTVAGVSSINFGYTVSVRTDVDELKCDLGSNLYYDGVTNNSSYTRLFSRYNNNYYGGVFGASSVITNTTSIGVYTSTRGNSTQLEDYKDGVSIGTTASNVIGVNTTNLYILAYYDWTLAAPYVGYFSSKRLSIVAMHTNLTSGEAALLNTHINTFNTALSR